jgi:hypothetical protein
LGYFSGAADFANLDRGSEHAAEDPPMNARAILRSPTFEGVGRNARRRRGFLAGVVSSIAELLDAAEARARRRWQRRLIKENEVFWQQSCPWVKIRQSRQRSTFRRSRLQPNLAMGI